MKFIVISITLLTLIMFNNVLALDSTNLSKGFSRADNTQPFRDIKSKFGYRPAYLLEVSENVFWGMSRDGRGVAFYNLATDGNVSGWPLTRWPHLQPPKEITESLTNFSIKNFNTSISHVPNRRTAGCLAQTPLRYGDIEQDGNAELALFLNGELILFSPQYKRTIFAAFWQSDDWMQETTEFNNKPSPESPHIYQFASAELALENLPYKAMRSYSKVYAGSFDQDNHADIIVWQKTYESNTDKEAPGFKLLSNTYQHYERDLTTQASTPKGVTGEYLPQKTDATVIQGWITTKQLTWQKGYPSKSECAGQENQLIPEMHDPLLNDPDVMK